MIDSKKSIFAWSLYDWANSAFSTTVMAGFFPVFFKENYRNHWKITVFPVFQWSWQLWTPPLGAPAHKSTKDCDIPAFP